jgi:tungstate transport system ATP-binding protein
MTPLVELEDVGVEFRGLAALAGVSLSIMQGEKVALIGANGSGKSTLLRVLHGLQRPAQGAVRRDSSMTQAMLFQRPHMLRVSALHNVALGLWLQATPWQQARAQARIALARVGLADMATRYAPSLSGGQQQRVALARAWTLQPGMLLLDEPTSSLDPHAKTEVEGLIAEFCAANVTLIFASHNLGQVKRLASRVVYLHRGRVLADLPVRDFFEGALHDTAPEAHLFLKGELG